MVMIAVVALIWMLPAIWTISLSFRPQADLLRSTSGFLPIPFTLDNYRAILQSSLVPRWFLNSIVVSVMHTVLVLAVSTLAAYAFARIPFKGKSVVFPLTLAGLMVPSQVTFIPIYLFIANLQWHNTYQALALPGVSTPFGLFLLTQFFKAIPKEIEEAAMLDGANRLTILVRIILPLSVPALTTLGLITFLGIWNDFLWPLISATLPQHQTITVGLPLLVGDWGTQFYLGRVLAAAWVGGVPVLIVFLLFQRYLIRGMSIGETF
jgi:multiple sugar transport system permease protein